MLGTVITGSTTEPEVLVDGADTSGPASGSAVAGTRVRLMLDGYTLVVIGPA